MGLYCILCGRRDKSVSYIRFPSNKKIRKQWLKFCRKSEKYLYDSHRVCTDHFKPEDLRKHSRCTLIQPEAVPCIYPVNEVFLKIENFSDDIDNKDNICVTNNDSESQAVNDNINVNYSQSTTVTESAHCSKVHERKCLNFHSNLVSNDDIDLKIPIHESSVLSACTSTICESHPPMISDPRYPGDIRSLHLATSRRAKRAMKVMQHIIMQQRRKIQSLQKKYSRCKQRISLLKDLNKRNYITETAADNLMVIMSAINIKALARQNIRKFLNSFDTVLTDCDGVLWMHMTPLPRSADVVNLFRRLGKRVFYVTNNSTKTRDDLVEKCRALRFETTKDDILCTAHLSACYLQSLGFRKKVYVIGSEAIAKELEQAGISYCGIGPDPIKQNIPYSVFDKDPEVAAVIVGFDEHFSYPKMVKAATYLNDANVHFIGTNTDERFPVSNDVVIPGTGSLVRCIESCSERKAVIMGKPDEYMAKMLMERSDMDPQRTLMIGDRCNTDILFGTHCGFTTLLVLTGVTALSDVERWKRSERQEERDLVPNYYVDALGDLLPYLKELETEMS